MRTATSLLALALGVSIPAVSLAQNAAVSSAQSAIAIPANATAHPSLWPSASSPDAMSDAATEAFVAQLLSTLTLEEKVGQMIQGDLASVKPEDLARYPLGSILAGGNS